jgi:hypothetical protein
MLPSFHDFLEIPHDDLCRSWAANRTMMLLKVSKTTSELIKKLHPPVEVTANFRFFQNDFGNDKSTNEQKLQFMMSRLEELASKCMITKLNLTACKIELVMFKLNKILSQSPFLNVLDLSYNQISCRQAAFLAESIKECSVLKELNLETNGFGNHGAMIIAKMLLHNTSLTRLNLGDNFIHDGGVETLTEALLQCTTLTHLDLCGNFISDEGAAKLAAVLPHCAILVRYADRP